MNSQAVKVFRGWTGSSLGSCVTVGNFDGVHQGHQRLLALLNETASADMPKIVMTFEPHPLAVLKPELAPARVIDLHTKVDNLASHGVTQINIIHFTRRFAELSAEEFIQKLHKRLNMRRMVVGGDFRFGNQRAGDVQLLEKLAYRFGFELETAEDFHVNSRRVSSKLLRETMAAGEIELTSQLLGRPYRFSGRVVKGDGIGRSLGFPTANLSFAGNIALKGIFAAQAYLDGQKWPTALSIGHRPVVNGTSLCIEAHLIGFTDNIYSRKITIEPIKKLREEKNFLGLVDLRAAIAEDVRNCLKILDNRK